MTLFSKLFSTKDSRGEESVTRMFVTIGWAVLTVKFMLAGVAVKFGAPPAATVEFSAPPMTATEYGLAFAGIIGIWLGREYQKQNSKDKAGT